MCGFISAFSKKTSEISRFAEKEKELMRLIERRGPDTTSRLVSENMFISHALLAINDYVTQPIENDDYIVFMNGEIYNEGALKYGNDTKWILDYLTENQDLKKLDGEFIICAINKKTKELLLLSDPFATKPCFVALTEETISISSYSEPLFSFFGNQAKIFEFPPNGVLKFDLDSYSVKSFHENISWDFNPKSTTFDNWNIAFKNSIRKRTNTDKQVFLGLSSGYDSGLIVSELIKQKKSFNSYSIVGSENTNILYERINLVNDHDFSRAHLVKYDQNRYNLHKAFIDQNSSNYPYRCVNDKFLWWMLEDKAAVGLSMICEDAKSTNSKIYLSGQGADEIFSDYSTQPPIHGTIRGNYTSVRAKWKNFDSGFQRNFLSKEERIPGAWGIEARYPFLDRYVVQEFLWLNDGLKNLEYKQCLAQLLRINNFPFSKNEKRGFNPLNSINK